MVDDEHNSLQQISKWSDDESENGPDDEMPQDEVGKFFWSIRHDMKMFEALLEKNKDLIFEKSENQYTALHTASSEGVADAVQLLLQAGSHVNALTDDGWTPLHCACKWNNLKVAKFLLHN